MSAAATTVIAALIAGAFGILVAIVNAAVGRDGRRTDKMSSIADHGLELLEAETQRREQCEETLSIFKRVLRALVRAIGSGENVDHLHPAYIVAVDTLDSH